MDLVYSTFGAMTHGQILFMNLCRHWPGWLIRSIFEMGSGSALKKIREHRDHAYRVASELIEQKRREMEVGQSEKDILSLLGAPRRVSPTLIAKINIAMVAL